jgi:3-dehydroquinate synthase
MVAGLDWSQYSRLHGMVGRLGLELCPREIDEKAIIDSIGFDKKRRGDRIILPLIRRIGSVGLYELGLRDAEEMVAKAWRRACGEE